MKSFFTNIDYVKILDHNGIVKEQYLPIINNKFKKIEIKHLNSHKKIISTSLDDLYLINKNKENTTLLIQFKIDNGKNLSTIINDYIDDTNIIDIFDINKIPYTENSKVLITLFRCNPINKELSFSEISKMKINEVKSL